MKTLLTGLCCFFFTFPSLAGENPLIGTWQSDHEKTMDFIRNNTKMTDKQYAFSDQIFGHMKVTFTKNQICFWMPDWQFNDKTMKGLQEGFEWEDYTLLNGNKDEAVISSYDLLQDRPGIAIYQFENPDSMWVYTGYTSTLHAREYFKRIPTPAVSPCRTPDNSKAE